MALLRFPEEIHHLQFKVCAKYGVVPMELSSNERVGISMDCLKGSLPINGLRMKPEGGVSWYFWSGKEMGTADDFFQPLHAEHLIGRCTNVLPFLLLPPGWRFYLDEGLIDVWSDPALLREPQE